MNPEVYTKIITKSGRIEYWPTEEHKNKYDPMPWYERLIVWWKGI